MKDVNEQSDARDDKLLSQLLDNALPQAEADALTERLAREPQLAERLEALRAADDSVRELFAKLDAQPLPQAVLDLLDAGDDSATADPAKVIAFPRRFVQRFAQMPVAIAASVALAAGFFVDRLLDEDPAMPAGTAALQAHSVSPNSEMHAFLETAPSAAATTLADGSEARILLTFADPAGDWCRQLSVQNQTSAVQALSCRRAGRWHNEIIAFDEPAGGPYSQAWAGNAVVVGAAVDQLIGDGEPLDRDQEADLIRNHWQKIP